MQSEYGHWEGIEDIERTADPLHHSLDSRSVDDRHSLYSTAHREALVVVLGHNKGLLGGYC